MYQQPLIAPGTATFQPDARRNAKYQPGLLLHSATLDQQALECLMFESTFPVCCCKEQLARATFLDVYSNGVIIGKPRFCCCFGVAKDTSVGVFHHFDDDLVFGNMAVQGEACSPFPFCFVDCFACFGEALVLQGMKFHGFTLFAHGNQYNTCSYLPCIASVSPISVMYGLAPGEASRVATVINQAVATFRSGRWPTEPRIAMSLSAPPKTPMIADI